jgi:uncharacterized oxidoreductase
MNDPTVKIEPDALVRLTAAIVAAAGSETEEAEIVADRLVRANLAGHDSHGVGMLPTYVHLIGQDLLRPNTPARLLKDEGAILIFDGERGYGQRVGREAMEVALDRARQHGLVMRALRDNHDSGVEIGRLRRAGRGLSEIVDRRAPPNSGAG